MYIDRKAINRLYNFAVEEKVQPLSSSSKIKTNVELTKPRQFSPSHPLGSNPNHPCCTCGDTVIRRYLGVYACIYEITSPVLTKKFINSSLFIYYS